MPETLEIQAFAYTKLSPGMTNEEIAAVLAEHKLWVKESGGKRANLRGADLSCANLFGADLSCANLGGADLRNADLGCANLRNADLRNAKLRNADLRDADLGCANLRNANLLGADLRDADLGCANLRGADLRDAKLNNDKTAIDILRRATRSDGWEFFLWHCQDGFYVTAGCRFFDISEARQHWTDTRAGTPLGDESLDILDMFEKAIQREFSARFGNT